MLQRSSGLIMGYTKVDLLHQGKLRLYNCFTRAKHAQKTHQKRNTPKYTVVLVTSLTIPMTSACWMLDVRYPVVVNFGWHVLVSAL